MSGGNRCKDCPPDKTRPAPHPGPRCATHWREERGRRKDRAYDLHLQKTYGITLEEYEALKELQGGVCFICQRATGKTKRLAVDHDHETGRIRGILCGPDNVMVGRARSDPDYFRRAAEYLEDPPARRAQLDREVPT